MFSLVTGTLIISISNISESTGRIILPDHWVGHEENHLMATSIRAVVAAVVRNGGG
jgi:hypothetical protein